MKSEWVICDFCGTVTPTIESVLIEIGLDICQECVLGSKRGEEGSHRLSKQVLENVPG